MSCIIYKIPVNFSLSLDMKPGASNPNKCYRKRAKGNTSKGSVLPGNFHRDELFHLNSPPEFPGFPYKWEVLLDFLIITGGD